MTASSFDVAILGAGMAGLAAAQVLRTTRPELSVVLLEGRALAGGRIRWSSLPGTTTTTTTTNTNALYMDEGAQYLHGICRQHPLRQVAAAHGIPYQPFDWDEGLLLVANDADDETWSDAQEAKEERVLRGILRGVARWQKDQRRKTQPANDDVSLESLVQPLIQQACDKDASLSAARLRALLEMEICDDYGADLAALSALSFDQDDVLSPTDAVPCTYQRIVEAVLAPVQDLVRYQHCVMHMDFPDDSSGRVRLQCRVGVGDKDNGDESEQRQVEVSARRVISTLPLGVLQQQSAQLFQPPLPPPLQASLGRLGYGCLEKVWLVFDTATAEEPFWPTDTDVFYHGGASPTPFRSWFLPAQVYQNDDYRHVLCCFVSGTAARALADQSADAVGAAALAALRQVFAIGSQHVLRHVHVTRWSKDPWSGGGSYSHMAVGSTAADYTVWTHGFYDQRLWWAGEATSARYPGTVHGAYFSGERAAQDCLASLP